MCTAESFDNQDHGQHLHLLVRFGAPAPGGQHAEGTVKVDPATRRHNTRKNRITA
jgi:hypothetical protein